MRRILAHARPTRLPAPLAAHLAALRLLLVLTVITGLLYPVAVTVIGRLPGLEHRADGSVLTVGGRPVGSALIGQSFTGPDDRPLVRYFQSRPSAGGYDPTASGASNLGPESTELLAQVRDRSLAVRRLEGINGMKDGETRLPADAVTASGSGLDFQISPAYARLQVARVARERGATTAQIERLVTARTTGRALGFLGEPGVNVLELNLDLDRLYPVRP